MTVEADLMAAVTPILPRFYPDVAPAGTARPYGVFQQVGGYVVNPMANAVPGVRNARVQVIVWADTRLESNTLMRQIEDAIRPSPLLGQPVSALAAMLDDETRLRGAMQDFLIWHT